ncbi:hypothetical protein [Paenimyroides aestuarii]|uniref:Uncharacterized protein n=1 Tax=Paenimyroides aestuarii TaxID=2968490 RepID=A0ABY5NSN6_9FLAO|nr:hypothetical protein [Paenimyroides aestuarii]UUV21595.1 hypothetical protein NPX36_00620 [Paenimyroides aestuarii]
MRNIIIVFISIFFLSCTQNDDNNARADNGTTQVTQATISYISQEPTPQGKYLNYIQATVQNTKNTIVTGFVQFKIKEYGDINSSTLIIDKNSEVTFYALFETDKIINETYLLSSKFLEDTLTVE